MRALLILIGLGMAVVLLTFLLDKGERLARADRERTGSPIAPGSEGESAERESAPEPAVPTRTLTLVVKGADGRRLEGVEVTMHEGFEPDSPLIGEPVRSNEDGVVDVTLPESLVFLVFRHPAYLLLRRHVPGSATKIDDIVLKPGAPLQVLVLDPDRKALRGARVSAQWRREHGVPGMWSWTSSDDLGRAISDEEGLAQVGGVPTGEIQLSVEHERYALTIKTIIVSDLEPRAEEVVLDWGGTISGRVLAPDGTPVKGARIYSQQQPDRFVESRPDGSYTLAAVAAGSVQLVATAEDYGPGYFGDGMGWGRPVPLPVKSGQTLHDIDIRLSKPTTIRGRVVTENGTPVASVRVSRGRRGQLFSAQEKEAATDAEGRFRLGPYSVDAGKTLGVWIYFHSQTHSVAQKSIQLRGGEDHDLGDVIATSKGVLRGVVLDADGNPAVGTFVHAVRRNESYFPSLDGHWIVDSVGAVVENDGTFEIRGVSAGKFRLQAQDGEKGLYFRSKEMEISAGQTLDGIELKLEKRLTIVGKVTTPTGQPRSGHVAAVPADAESPYTGAYTATWANHQTGAFRLDNLKPGEYRVGLIDDTFRVLDERAVNASGGTKGMVLMEEPAPQVVKAGTRNLVLHYALQGAIVHGRVVAKDTGLPIRSFEAGFIQFRSFIPVNVDASSVDDDNGEFRYELDEPGTWSVEVKAPGYASFRTHAFKVQKGEVKDVGTLKLGLGGTIKGIVLDAAGQPVPFTRINILSPKMETNANQPFTDMDGAYSVPGISPGTYTVFAVSPSHPMGMVRGVEVKEGKETDVEVKFLQASPLELRVLDETGRPIANARLSYTFDAVRPLTSKMFRSYLPPGFGPHRTDAEGVIVKPSLPPGKVSLTIEASGYVTRNKIVDLKPGESNRLEVRLKRARE